MSNRSSLPQSTRKREERWRLNDASPPSPPKRTRSPSRFTPSDEDAFVWKKKVEQQKKRGERIDAEAESIRREELAAELESAKKRRAERDAERAEREAQLAQEARQREQEDNEGWHKDEAKFHGQQHFLRQAIRLRQGRGGGTDLLATNLRFELVDVALDDTDPVEKLRQLDVQELKEGVERELDFVMDLEGEGIASRELRREWWECVKECLREGEGVHKSVREDVEKVLKGSQKLLRLEREIREGIEEGEDEFAEGDFWTAVLARIRVVKAERRLREINEGLIYEKKQRMKEVPKVEKTEEGSLTERQMMEREVAKGMREDEEEFKDEVETRKRAEGYAWNDKFRPRKPRYYNRVHTGYDWTKYNRTHYDRDNPPPKTVQGYRFNIFYPDLIDPTRSPTYTITKTENPEVCIITFKAGPPYEDVAFKIVNRPWERSHRRGFRCSFDKGILQMWFNFQRYRYRR